MSLAAILVDGAPGDATVDDDNNGITDYVDTNGNGVQDPGEPIDFDELFWPGTNDNFQALMGANSLFPWDVDSDGMVHQTASGSTLVYRFKQMSLVVNSNHYLQFYARIWMAGSTQCTWQSNAISGSCSQFVGHHGRQHQQLSTWTWFRPSGNQPW